MADSSGTTLMDLITSDVINLLHLLNKLVSSLTEKDDIWMVAIGFSVNLCSLTVK
ncbi:hypothetical protein ACJIZ3_018900 [Penstemon smallii]|uniref:Uncharacterized protein n=1 Tax=Penstemon smallii TaxID=265156 RepID=A0ABD3T0W0_9LAMI